MFKPIWRRAALALALILTTFIPLPARAAENDGLLASFGGFGIGGVVANAPLAINAIALQSDGKIVAVGVKDNTFAAARYGSDGQLDASFGAGGVVVTSIAGGQQSAVANDVALQPDGKIVVVGTVESGTHYFAVVRYDSNGALDNTFSDNGILYAGFQDKGDYAGAVGIDSAGRIMVGGTARIGGDDFAVMALTPDGLFDNGFSGDGRATIGFGDGEDSHDLLIQPDGKIVLVGETNYRSFLDPVFGHYFALARLNPNGSLDGSFNGDGKRTSKVGDWNYAYAGALDSNGRIVAVGESFEVARFYPSGALDPNFDGDGKLTTPIAHAQTAYDVVILPDNKFIAAGAIDNQIGLARYNFDGSLDRGFDGDGVLLLDILPDAPDAARSIMRTPDGRLVVAGGSVIVRLFADGTLDSGGRQIAAPAPGPQGYTRIAQAVLAQPDGAIVSAGLVHRGGLDDDIALTRHLPSGAPDPSFGSNGERVVSFAGTSENVQDAALAPDGKIVVVGNSRVDLQSDLNLLLARFRPDGSPDSDCGLFGIAIKDLLGGSSDTASSVAIQPDGKILVAGLLGSEGGSSPYVARFTANCGLDPSFSGDGIAPLGYGNIAIEVLALPDGKALLVGQTTDSVYLARYTAGGVLDISFGGDGIITTLIGENGRISAAALQPSTGKILVAGAISTLGSYDFLLLRYTAEGALDTSFGNDGRTTTDMGDSEFLLALAVRDDGEIALGGCTTVTGLAVVALYTPEGVRDTSLSGDGISTFRAGGFTCIKDATFSNGRLIVAGYAANDANLSFALGAYALERAPGGGTSRSLAFVTATGDSTTYAESATSILLTVRLSQTAAQTVTVQYAATGGTATNGADYVLAPGTLTFAPGQTSQRISVPITNDRGDEVAETIVIALRDATNAALSDAVSVTLTIADDDDGSSPPAPGPPAARTFIFLPLVRR